MEEKHEVVYDTGAETYDRLIEREDWEGHLLPAIRDIVPVEDAVIVESGAGTGRLTRLLAPDAASLTAFDMSASMLAKAAEYVASDGLTNVSLAPATHDALPVKDDLADLVISGWSVCYCATWGEGDWRPRVDVALQELLRVCKDDGTCLLIETLGTGFASPTPPGSLVPYLDYLERQWGFSWRWIRTDYRFTDAHEAKELVTYFFGEARARRALSAHRAAGLSLDDPLILPECTGLWWRRGASL